MVIPATQPLPDVQFVSPVEYQPPIIPAGVVPAVNRLLSVNDDDEQLSQEVIRCRVAVIRTPQAFPEVQFVGEFENHPAKGFTVVDPAVNPVLSVNPALAEHPVMQFTFRLLEES